MQHQRLLLYSYFRSSCSARIRIAAHLKNIPLEYRYIHLLSGDQLSESYTAFNPSASVPTLIFTAPSGDEILIRQSVAILEFLEEYFPSSLPLLPPKTDVIGRARVRELVNIISCDVQPPTNLRILKKVKKLGGEDTSAEWAKELIGKGLEAYDKVTEKYAGTYSVGNTVSLADVVLAPAVEGALRYGVDIEKLPTVNRIYQKIKVMDAFQKGDWKHQEDTPPEFKAV